MTWKEKTCERCVFRVGDECRRFPPVQDDYVTVEWFSRIFNSFQYQDACAEYAELIEPTEE